MSMFKHECCPECGADGQGAFWYDMQRCECGWNALNPARDAEPAKSGTKAKAAPKAELGVQLPRRGLASIVREALRHSPGEQCSCMRDDAKAKHRGCYGVCEDAVDRVVAALASSNSGGVR